MAEDLTASDFRNALLDHIEGFSTRDWRELLSQANFLTVDENGHEIEWGSPPPLTEDLNPWRGIKKRSMNKLIEAYSLALVAMKELDAADDDCAGFDEFDSACHRSLEQPTLWHLHHTIYVADQRHKEHTNASTH